VHRYEGTVNQVMGDGIMALFGAPIAHEDHAVRACYAALAMQEAIGRYSAAERQPVLAVWEDLHWADPSTLELLSLISDQVPTARLLTLMTSRPEFRPPWAPRSHFTRLTLGRLPRPQVETMVRQLTADKPLPAEVLAEVVAKTDGVPLFVEELVKMLLESGLVREEADRYAVVGPLPPLAIPATVQDSLMARLDRLAAARAVAQLGAVLGREFTDGLIRALALLDDATLQQGLAQLVAAELLYQRGRPPQATYLFKHALIQEAAYQSLLKSTRQQFHQRAAQVLEARFSELCETQPELLAHHLTEAGLTAQALGYWQRAGQRALARSANLEAIGHLTTGIALLETLPESPTRAAQELLLLITLGPALMATQGYASPEAGRTYARARALCQEVEGTPQLAQVFFGLWVFYHARAEHTIGRELSEQFLTLACRMQDPALLLVGHQMVGQSLFCLGELAHARERFKEALAYDDPEQHRALALLYVMDPVVASHAWLSFTLWLLGYPDHAQRHNRTALTLAHELGHALTQGSALAWAAFFHALRGEG
jgi:predicted ATPase